MSLNKMTTTQIPGVTSLLHEFDNENSTNNSVGGSSQNSVSSSASSISLSPVNYYKDVYGVAVLAQKNNETLDSNNNSIKLHGESSMQKDATSGDALLPKIYSHFQNEVSISSGKFFSMTF